MNKSLYTIITMAKINTRRVFRDKVALFFTIGFPLIFLFVFGGLNSGGNDISFNVAVINESESTFAKDFAEGATKNNVLSVDQEISTLDQAKEKMSRSELDAAIVLPKGFGEVAPGAAYPTFSCSTRCARFRARCSCRPTSPNSPMTIRRCRSNPTRPSRSPISSP